MIGMKNARRVADLFWPTFEERDGCVVFAGGKYPQLAQLETRTAAEAFYSHTHILDEFLHSIPFGPHPEGDGIAPDWSHPEFAVACELARVIGQMWLRKLEADFPNHRFRVYVTTLDDPIVRFHRVYANERPWHSDEEAAAAFASGEVSIFESDQRDYQS